MRTSRRTHEKGNGNLDGDGAVVPAGASAGGTRGSGGDRRLDGAGGGGDWHGGGVSGGVLAAGVGEACTALARAAGPERRGKDCGGCG